MFNFGKKDEHGRQRRVEHRGKYLRASRTGGVALRAQTEMAGVNFTANSNRGVRISTAVGPGTQVAMQNGRFVLKGRYGAGPLNFNLSKSGVSASAKNKIGSFNLTNPNRSSVKLGGVQVRGQKAASIQSVYMLFALAFQLVILSFKIGVFLLKLAWLAIEMLIKLLVAMPAWIRSAGRSLRNRSIRRRMVKDAGRLSSIPNDPSGLETSLTLVYEGWGRGRAAGLMVEEREMKGEKASVAKLMDENFGGIPQNEREIDIVMGSIASQLKEHVDPEKLPEIMLAMDDRAIGEAPRTRRQARLLEVFSDFAGLRLAVTAEQSA